RSGDRSRTPIRGRRPRAPAPCAPAPLPGPGASGRDSMDAASPRSGRRMEPMKAIAVIPGTRDSIHLREAPAPRLEDVPDGRGVLVRVLRVGVDGTDKEINAAEYGAPPPGDDYLILGHESLGRVEAVGPGVDDLAPGDLVVATVRRPGGSLY